MMYIAYFMFIGSGIYSVSLLTARLFFWH